MHTAQHEMNNLYRTGMTVAVRLPPETKVLSLEVFHRSETCRKKIMISQLIHTFVPYEGLIHYLIHRTVAVIERHTSPPTVEQSVAGRLVV